MQWVGDVDAPVGWHLKPWTRILDQLLASRPPSFPCADRSSRRRYDVVFFCAASADLLVRDAPVHRVSDRRWKLTKPILSSRVDASSRPSSAA